MSRIKDFFIVVGVILTLPICVIFVIIILFSIPKDFYEKYDEHMEAME